MKDKSNPKEKKETASPSQSSPPKKSSLAPRILLVLLFLISAAATYFIVSEQARNSAREYFDNIVSRVASNSLSTTEDGVTVGAGAAFKLQNNLVAKFTELELRDADYSIQHFPQRDSIDIVASIPRGRPLELIIWELSAAAQGTPYSVEDVVCAPTEQTNCTITFVSRNQRHPRLVLRVRRSTRFFSNTAKMAIIIENFGFEANNTTVEFLSFPDPLTVSLLPAQRLAAWTAQIADEYKKEIILSLPMDPLPPSVANEYRASTIRIQMSEENIREIITQAATNVPNMSGIINFHGSRVMEDSRAMRIILAEAARRNVYFIYTDTARRSVVPQVVREVRTPSHPIQGTIGAEHNVEQVRERLRRFAATAVNNGRILITAPPTQAFIQGLKDERDMLRHNGIKLVYVSEIVR